MKRNKKRKPGSMLQLVPLRELVDLIKGWEAIKRARRAIEGTEAGNELSRILASWPDGLSGARLELETIQTSARAKVSSWLEAPSVRPSGRTVETKGVLSAILTLWEGLQAVTELAPDRRQQWLDALPLDTGHLLTRIEKRIS